MGYFFISGFYKLYPATWEKSPENQKAVERLFNRILTANRRDAEADMSAWEQVAYPAIVERL